MEINNKYKKQNNEQIHYNKSRQRKNTSNTQDEYKHKINNLIKDNQFTMINNPTQCYQKMLKQCNYTI
jgi:hypothetical protein